MLNNIIGLERTDNNMDLTSWAVVQPINQKNYYVEFLKRDEQLLAVRMQQEEARNKMVKKAKDRDRALAEGRQVGPEEDMDDDDDQEAEEDEIAVGNKTIVVHIGSQNLRVGMANDALPKTVPMVIARRAEKSESEENDGEPAPKRRKLDNGKVWPEAEKRFGDEFAQKFVAMSNDLKVRMRMNKRKVLPQSRDMVTSYNKRTMFDTITEHNDTLRIEWTDVSDGPEFVTGRAALRIPDNSEPRYRLFWPIQYGVVNEADYNSASVLYNDIQQIIEDAIRTELKLDLKTKKDWSEFSCVIVIPDYYERIYVTNLLQMALAELGFGKVCFIQESLAASFGAGFSTCCIIDLGAQKTSICCVEDGMVIDNSRVNLKYGGSDITEAFVKMIIYNHFPYAEVNLNRRHDFQLMEELKQKFCTMLEADISVQLYDFHLRAPGQDTRKYTFKTYDEVILAPMGLFKPEILNDSGKLTGRRKLIDRSYDIYDGKPNDPTSTAQAEILTSIAPEAAVAPPPKPKPKKLNGINGIAKDELNPDSRRGSMVPMDGTPQPSAASSPARKMESTPQPDGIDAGTPLPGDLTTSKADEPEPEEEEPLSIERRDDILPIHPLPSAIVTSITHAAKGSPHKTRDLLSSIMVIGGSSNVNGMTQYLEETLQALLPSYGKEIMISRPPRELDAQVVVWKGAAVFGRMSRTNDSWINGFLYERLGERCLAHKLMWAW
ncbi:hypothetical protein Dsin_033216 [Dipteronia sinensis]|uniref:Actin-related protein 8 n=1 Tax=Dipteronia sinensis TaxID=43782 RepID=A0AAD9ZEY0_9ROSI|nr:hypothetical protein Dsin_033216 [Dipteronia sinensis]